MPTFDGGTIDYTQFLNHNYAGNPAATTVNYDEYVIDNTNARDYLNRITIDPNRITIDPDVFNVNTETFTRWQDVTTTTDKLEEKLNEFAKRLYQIIDEHTNIDITEEEFMDLLLKGDD